jgi:hypothetical protein
MTNVIMFPNERIIKASEEIFEIRALKEAQYIRNALDYAQDAYGARLTALGIRRIYE